MRLTGYRLERHANARPASGKRNWMDAWIKKHPYRCWPLTVTNGYGWEMVCGSRCTVTWNGGSHKRDISIGVETPRCEPVAHSHFGGGVITFFPGCLFRTEQPFQLFVTGPLNHPKRGVSPLSAIVETSWLPYTFAMSYMVTEPGLEITFEADEPFCQFFPLDSRAIEKAEPEWLDLGADPILWRQYHEWSLQRKIAHGKVPQVEVKRHFETRYQRAVLSEDCLATDQKPTRYAVAAFVERAGDNHARSPRMLVP